MKAQLHLENFDEEPCGKPRENPEFTRGFEEGLEAGRAEILATQTVLKGEIVSAFSDAIFTYTEARQAILSELVPILEAITKGLLPAAANTGLASTISEILTDAITESASFKPSILVHPEMYDTLTQPVFDLDQDKFTLVKDASVPQYAAWLKTAHGETALDFENVISAALVALDTYSNPTQRNAENG